MIVAAGIAATTATVVLIVLLSWIALWGLAGVLTSRWRGRTPIVGFLLGAILGPLGLALIILGDVILDRLQTAGREIDDGPGGEGSNRSNSSTARKPIVDL